MTVTANKAPNRHSVRCISCCARFVYANDLWCAECAPQGGGCGEWPASCVPMRAPDGRFGVCCMLEAALERLGIDPYSNVSWRDQYNALHP